MAEKGPIKELKEKMSLERGKLLAILESLSGWEPPCKPRFRSGKKPGQRRPDSED